MQLSILDQSLCRSPDAAPIALTETIQMAQHAESLGYHRFWVSEHHAFPSVAGSAPEVLLAAIGAATSTIRIGSDGNSMTAQEALAYPLGPREEAFIRSRTASAPLSYSCSDGQAASGSSSPSSATIGST